MQSEILTTVDSPGTLKGYLRVQNQLQLPEDIEDFITYHTIGKLIE